MYIVGYLVIVLASTHKMPVVPLSRDNEKDLQTLENIPCWARLPCLRTGLYNKVLFEERVLCLWIFPSTSDPACPVLVFKKKDLYTYENVTHIMYDLPLFCLLTAELLITRCMWPLHLLPGMTRPPMLLGDTALS